MQKADKIEAYALNGSHQVSTNRYGTVRISNESSCVDIWPRDLGKLINALRRIEPDAIRRWNEFHEDYQSEERTEPK